MPDKLNFKRKTRKTTANPLKPLLKIIGSDTETDGGPVSGDRPRFDSKASISSQDSGIGSQEFEIFSQEEQSTKDVQRSSLVVNHLELSHGSKFSQSISLDSTNEKSSSGVNSLDLRNFGSTSDLKDFPRSSSTSDLGCFPSSESSQGTSQLCLMCCQQPKNASLIHGRLGHQVCFSLKSMILTYVNLSSFRYVAILVQRNYGRKRQGARSVDGRWSGLSKSSKPRIRNHDRRLAPCINISFWFWFDFSMTVI